MTDTIYFIQARRGGPIKIGYTASDPKRRLASLQTSAPERLILLGTCPGTRETEAVLHAELAEHRLVGEWFKDCPSVRAAMQTAIGSPAKKPRARLKPCGCVIGYAFCADADAAWRQVGLAQARRDQGAYAEALQTFGEHLDPDHVGIVASKVRQAAAA